MKDEPRRSERVVRLRIRSRNPDESLTELKKFIEAFNASKQQSEGDENEVFDDSTFADPDTNQRIPDEQLETEVSSELRAHLDKLDDERRNDALLVDPLKSAVARAKLNKVLTRLGEAGIIATLVEVAKKAVGL